MKDYYYEKLLHINTKRNRNHKMGDSLHYHPYEPTPYHALEELVKHHEITNTDSLVDFGCGLGRLNFFFHYFYRASVTGIEMYDEFYEKALENRESYYKGTRKSIDNLQFCLCKAEDYEIKDDENQFYFFHPFSIHIYRKVIQNILDSVERTPRTIYLILYYGHEDYLYYLENETNFTLQKEIRLPIEYKRNPYEKFLIYRLEIE